MGNICIFDVHSRSSHRIQGIGCGPAFWAPLSEAYGRKRAMLPAYFAGTIFAVGAGVSSNIQTLLITRFFGGAFAAAPVAITGGVMSDIWSAEQRGIASVAYTMAVVGGPTIGPIVGGAIIQGRLGWRWTEYVSAARKLSDNSF
ncbi:hypothetical protein EYZ11_005407 [Aspergillus tanneri]|uniref:Major facilitator superfamily (MFS) profile domain-containing protein n=1 Tax=Aspergillus tanneri TaxID=1220188 RepID=A0A4S3JIA3_9EURO|nr:hypothetical protein EYZ11_005407 [Aspergillus tanneri]